MDIQDIIRLSKSLYNLYDSETWERTAFFEESGVYVVTSLQRIERSRISGNEMKKFHKEQNMCMRFGCFGFQIEILDEHPGISSPDVNVVSSPLSCHIVVNGKKADLKSVSSANNILKKARYAKERQKAELVLFEFTQHAPGIENALKETSEKYGIHGFYYYSDENSYGCF